ncbi:type VII secretion integral membrane protein EccD [Mycobacterium marinum]|uniref:type VII secretion integral membrane protein EccD n=1 Tax=Mycobacterium marinum TaxID=1781 RepID=UPI00356813FE
MKPGTVSPIVRVAILADRRLMDVALPTELPLRELLPAVRRLVDPDEEIDEVGQSGIGDVPQISLAPIGGPPFSLDASLDTVGVVDGDLLALQLLPNGPAAPGVVEDIADAAMIFSRSRVHPWGIKHIQRGALAAAILLGFGVAGLAASYWRATGGLSGFIALNGVAAVSVLAGLLVTARSSRTGVVLSVAALVPICAALALVVPGKFGPAQILLAAAAVGAWALIYLIVHGAETQRTIAFFTAVAAVASAISVAATVELFWKFTMLSIGCGLIAAALLITVQAPQLSALWARLPLPVIPAPGDPTPSAPPFRALADLPRRVHVGDAHQNGLIAAAVLLSVLGSLAISWHPEAVSPLGWYLVVATALSTSLRARVWDSATCKSWLLGQPFVVAAVLLVTYTVTGRYLAALAAVLVLSALVLSITVVALNPKVASSESYSLPLRRLLGFFAGGLDTSLIPVIAYMVGLFAWILNR